MAESADKKFTLATVCYNYKPVSDNEVALVKGENVKVFEKFENGWWVGETMEGKLGVFPGSYVKEATDRPQSEMKASIPPKDDSKRPVSTVEVKKAKLKTKKPNPVSSALVLYDYEGQTATELTLKKGDTISILRKLQADGWWQGEANGKIGHFPASYVRETSPEAIKEETTIEATTKQEENKEILKKIFAVALYDYTGLSKEELNFKKGDYIIISPLLNKESGWSVGECKNGKGTFPIKYVREIDFATLSKTAPSTWAISLYNFQGMDTSELNLSKGDIIEIVEQKADDAWWKGKADHCVGHFPGNYIKMLPCQDEVQGMEVEAAAPKETNTVATEQPEPSVEPENDHNVSSTIRNTVEPIQQIEIEPETTHSEEPEKQSVQPSEEVVPATKEVHEIEKDKVEQVESLEVEEVAEIAEIEEGIAAMKMEEENVKQDKKMDIESSQDIILQKEVAKAITKGSPNVKRKRRKKSVAMTTIGTCVAKFDYNAPKKGILSFSSGDTIQIYSKAKEGAGWWKGLVNEQIGYFPLSFVKEKKNKVKRKKSYVRALYDYNGESETELSFKKGDIFSCIDAEPVGSGWGRGEHRGRAGHFPPTYVAPVEGEGEGKRENSSNNTVAASHSDIDDLRALVLSLQARMDGGSPSPRKRSRSESDTAKKLRESEQIRREQAASIATLSTKVDNLVVQVAKQNETIAKQQKSLRKLSKGGTLRGGSVPSGAPTGSAEDFEKMQAYLNIEVRQRRDLESLIRNLEANHEVLSRQVNRMQRGFDSQSTKEKMGKARLRSVGRDLTK